MALMEVATSLAKLTGSVGKIVLLREGKAGRGRGAGTHKFRNEGGDSSQVRKS